MWNDIRNGNPSEPGTYWATRDKSKYGRPNEVSKAYFRTQPYDCWEDCFRADNPYHGYCSDDPIIAWAIIDAVPEPYQMDENHD